MTLRALRSQHDRAYSAWLSTKSHRWAAEVSRLNWEIMDRVRPVRRRRLVSSGGPDAPAVRALTGEPQPMIES